MNQAKQNLIKLLLQLHKALLDMEKAEYERKNGVISNNNEYFNLVVNHEDFQWLRSLSELIALLDEEIELSGESQGRFLELLANLRELLSGEEETEFFLRYQAALAKNSLVSDLNKQLEGVIAYFLKSED